MWAESDKKNNMITKGKAPQIVGQSLPTLIWNTCKHGWNPIKKTNLITKGKAQQIVGQSLLSFNSVNGRGLYPLNHIIPTHFRLPNNNYAYVMHPNLTASTPIPTHFSLLTFFVPSHSQEVSVCTVFVHTSMGGLQQKSSHKRLIFNCARFNLLFSSHFTSIPTHFSLLCPHTQPRSKCKIRKMEINPSSRVIPYKKIKNSKKIAVFYIFSFF